MNHHEYTFRVAGGAVVIAELVYRGHMEAQVGRLGLNGVSVTCQVIPTSPLLSEMCSFYRKVLH